MFELMKYYKNLWDDVYAILKPYGFKRKGSNIYCIQENGIVKLIEMQKSRFNMAEWSRFTMNLGMSAMEIPVDLKKLKSYFMQMQMHLGSSREDGFKSQFWYDVTVPERTQPYLSPEDIHESVCDLIKNKAMVLFDSVQDKDDYFELLLENIGDRNSTAIDCVLNNENREMLGRIYGSRLTPVIDKMIATRQGYIDARRQEVPKGEESINEQLIEGFEKSIWELKEFKNRLGN